MLFHAIDALGNQPFVHERANPVMHEDNGVLRRMLTDTDSAKPIVNAFLPARPAGNDRAHLADSEFLKKPLQVRNPVRDTDDGNRIDLRVVLEVLQRVDYQLLAVELEELLGAGAAVHARAAAARENEGCSHMKTFFTHRTPFECFTFNFDFKIKEITNDGSIDFMIRLHFECVE